MKVKMVRCGICDEWLHHTRNHCPICGATRAIHVGNKVYHLDYTALMNGRTLQIVRGTWSHLTLKNLASKGE